MHEKRTDWTAYSEAAWALRRRLDPERVHDPTMPLSVVRARSEARIWSTVDGREENQRWQRS